MTKRIVSAALIMLLILSLFSVFAAADSFCNLGSVFSGAVLNYRIADIAEGCSAGGEGLPAGLQMSVYDGGIYISGVAQGAGEYTFTIYTDDPVAGNIICNVIIVPSAPEVVSSADVDCFVGDYALMSVSPVSGDGPFGYQWYAGCTQDGMGGYAIIGANGPEYSPSTGEEGTTYYNCMITTGSGASATSRAIRVTVNGMQVEGISVNTFPNIVNYRVGEYPDVSGLTLKVRYANGSTGIVSEGINVDFGGYDEANCILTLNIEYKGCRCSVPLLVTPAEPEIAGIGMVRLPDKQQYKPGERFDGTGLIFRVYFQDGTYSDESSDYTVEPAVLSGIGTQNMTLSYKNYTCTFPVSVAAAESSAPQLEVASTPAKLSYTVGERADTAGLVLRETVDGVPSVVRNGFTVSPEVFTTPGRQTVTVMYNGQVAYYTVDVYESEKTADGKTVDTEKITSKVKEKLGSAIEKIDIKSAGNANKGAIVVVLVVALLALGALGVYMVVLENGGVEEIKYKFECYFYNLKSRFRKKK